MLANRAVAYPAPYVRGPADTGAIVVSDVPEPASFAGLLHRHDARRFGGGTTAPPSHERGGG
jgi:hypothetical protein